MSKFFRTLKTRFPNFIPSLGYVVMKLLWRTLRPILVNAEIPRAFHAGGQGTIQIMWHARLLLGPFAYQGNNGHILISSHGDGEIIARITTLFGFAHIRGSSSKGGKRALLQMLSVAKQQGDVIITPDGPRGPAETVKPGVAQVAKMTGLPVIPFGVAVSSAVRLNSWDRFVIPLPFSRCYFVWGEPLWCGDAEDVEGFRLRIEAALRATTQRADGMANA